MIARTFVATTLLSMIFLAHAATGEEIRAGDGLTIETGGRAEVIPARYDCGTGEPLRVSYVNADPNHLAVVPVEGQALVFTSAISASGSRFTAGKYEWWEARGEAMLRDLTAGENAEPLMRCKALGGE